MMKKTYQGTASIILIILILSLFMGYTYITDVQSIQQINAKILTIDDINLKFSSAIITFSLNITNPSTRDIHNVYSTFNLYIEQNFIGRGSFSNITLPAQTNRIKQVTMTINYAGLADSTLDFLKNYIRGQSTVIVVEGTLHASVLFGLTKASHSYTATSD
jgi:hypothetical protein